MPIEPGVGIMATPADSRDLIFSLTLPWDPVMMAPAWPIRLPSGALCPTINAAIGLEKLVLIDLIL